MDIQKSASHRGLVFDLRPEQPHTGITDRATARPIAGHPFDVQIFDSNHAEFSRYAVTELVYGILPNVSNPFMELGKLGFRFPKIGTAFGLSGQ